MNCHITLTQYIGKQISIGEIVHAYSMLNSLNDMFIIRHKNGTCKKYLRSELLDQLEKLHELV